MKLETLPLYSTFEKKRKTRALYPEESGIVAELEQFLYYRYKTIPIRNNKQILIVHISDILYFRSSSNYSIIYFKSGKEMITSKSLKFWESIISDYHFVRCHNSFFINTTSVEEIDIQNNALFIEGTEIPISRARKSKIIDMFS